VGVFVRIYQQRLEQQFELISELRKTNGKLEGDIEYQKQSHHLLMKQSESAVKDAHSLRERLVTVEARARNSEERVASVTNELLAVQGHLAQLR
jgi:chromosome segregation ATPase